MALPDTAALAARRYVLTVATGASPFAMAIQVPEVTEAAGRRRMAHALEAAGLGLIGARARVDDIDERGQRADVTVHVSGESIKSRRFRFVLVARAGRWQVVGDSLTARALSELEPRRVLRRYLAAARRVAGGY